MPTDKRGIELLRDPSLNKSTAFTEAEKHAVGMAIFATQAKLVTDEMFIEAGQTVADQVPADLLKQGLLYPLQSNILETEIQTAARVAKLVFDAGLARVKRPADMVSFSREHVYKPEYATQAARKSKPATRMA